MPIAEGGTAPAEGHYVEGVLAPAPSRARPAKASTRAVRPT